MHPVAKFLPVLLALTASAHAFAAETGTRVADAAAQATPAAPVSPAAAWAASYLANAAMLAELDAALAVLSSTPPTGDAAKNAVRDAAMKAPAFDALRRRAAFALDALAAKSQTFALAPAMQASIAAHPVAPVPKVADAAALADTFVSDAHRALWKRLARAYALDAPTCPLDADAVRAFAERQRAALAAGRQPGAADVLTPLAGWPLAKTQCLAAALMAMPEAKKRDDGYDPTTLLLAVSSPSSPFAHDAALKALTAVRMLELSRYPVALGAIMDLIDLDEAFRLPYEIVQRVFALKQKGEGAVALQGL